MVGDMVRNEASGSWSQAERCYQSCAGSAPRKAKPPRGPSAQVLPVPAFLQEKGLRGRDCVYLTTKGKCIAGKRLTCKNSLEMGFLARGQRLLGVMNINFQRT